MSYLDRNLLSDERILFRTKKSLIIFFFPALWLVFSVYATDYMKHDMILQKLVWAPWVVAAVLWISVWLEYYFSEFAITTKRVMMREGFFVRHANELRLTTISQVNVEQSLFGQMLNYGTVALNAFGAFDDYTLISKPFQFQQIVNQQLDTLVSGPR